MAASFLCVTQVEGEFVFTCNGWLVQGQERTCLPEPQNNASCEEGAVFVGAEGCVLVGLAFANSVGVLETASTASPQQNTR